MDGKILKPELKVPEQKTASLSFCDTTPKAFRVWADQLPMANTGEASRQLYHAIIELNHLFLSPLQRMQFLEIVRDKIHFVCNELSRHFLGLAIALPVFTFTVAYSISHRTFAQLPPEARWPKGYFLSGKARTLGENRS